MNTLLIINGILFLSELLITTLSMAVSTTLFLECRWSRKKSIAVFLLISLIPGALCAIVATPFFRMFGTTAICFGALCLVTQGRYGKKLLIFLAFYTVFVFSEAMVSFLANKIRPSFGAEELLRINQLRMLDKIMYYNYYRVAFVPLVLAVTLLLMHLIYVVFNRDFLELKSTFVRPFAFLGSIQISFVIFTTYFINAYVSGPYVYVILMLVQILMLAIILWITWQLSVTVKRLETEKRLEILRCKKELDVSLYEEICKGISESGSFRHDYQNQMQIIDYLLKSGEGDNLEKAENMLEELYMRLEYLERFEKLPQTVATTSSTSAS